MTIAKWATRLCALGWIATFILMEHLPPPVDIEKSSLEQPVQTDIAHDPFAFKYKAQTITVVPQAAYTISGVIVSHNDPGAWYMFDLSHDENSPDTRDLCLLYGSNLQHTDYNKVKYSSDDWMCNYSWADGVTALSEDEISNNHLITDQDSIREQIKRLHTGDQVTISGLLVNYTEERWNGRYRNSSLTRADRGNGACEVIFVQSLKLVDSYNHPWILLHIMLGWAFVVLFLLRTLAFFILPPQNVNN